MNQLYPRQHAYPYPTSTYQTRVSVEGIFHQLQAHIMHFDLDTQQRLAQLMLKDCLQRNLLRTLTS